MNKTVKKGELTDLQPLRRELVAWARRNQQSWIRPSARVNSDEEIKKRMIGRTWARRSQPSAIKKKIQMKKKKKDR